MKKSCLNMIRIATCFCFCMASLLPESTPEISVSQYIVTPRINLFNDPTYDYHSLPGMDNEIFYRTQLDVNYQISERVHLSCITEFGSPNYRYDQSFRLQSLITDIHLDNYTVLLGRQTLRNPFYNTYLDGISVSSSGNTDTRFSMSAGYIPEFYSNPGEQKQLVQASGKFYYDKGATTLAIWDIINHSKNSYKAGLINRHRFSDRINFTTYLSWDMQANLPFYNRFHLRYRAGNHIFYLGYRQRIFNMDDLYPWIPNEKWIVKSLYAGGIHQISRSLTVRLLYSLRNADNQGSQIQAMLQYKNYSLTVLSGDTDGNKLTGGIFTLQHDWNPILSFGGNISLNSLDAAGENELIKSKAAYGWVDVKISKKLKVRIFGQYSENSYYNKDGRGGIFLTYDL